MLGVLRVVSCRLGRARPLVRRTVFASASTLRRSSPLSASTSTAQYCTRRWASEGAEAGSNAAALLRLLQDPTDAYLPFIREMNLNGVVEALKRGPSAAALEAQRRMPSALPGGAAAVYPAPPLSADSSVGGASPAEAVLEGLRVHGLQRHHDTLVEKSTERVKQQAEAAAQLARCGSAEQEERRQAASVQHTWEGLCALNAVLRMVVEGLLERQTESEEEKKEVKEALTEALETAYGAYTFVVQHYTAKDSCDWRIPQERWEADYVPELQELEAMFRACGDERKIVI